MNEVTPPRAQMSFYRRPPVKRGFWRELMTLSGWLVAAVALWAIVLVLVKPVYEADLIVGPTQSSNGSAARGNILQAAGGVSSLLGSVAGGLASSNDFIIFRSILTSQEIADVISKQPHFRERVFPSQWDPVAQEWRKPRGVVSSIAKLLRSVLGIPEREQSDRARIAEFLEESVTVNPIGFTGLYEISCRDRDPQVAQDLLKWLYTAADDKLRSIRRNRDDAAAEYYNRQMNDTSIALLRAPLTEMYVRQKTGVIEADLGAPFAAEMVSGPTLRPRPVRPRPGQWLAIAVILGLMGGSGTIYRRRRRESADSANHVS